MEPVPAEALRYAQEHHLDLTIHHASIPTAPFVFKCLAPRKGILDAFAKARQKGQLWPHGMPIPVVTYHKGRHEWQIMDGMNRICAAQMEGFQEIPAYVASGETHEILYEHILKDGYFGEDFVEVLAAVSPMIRSNLRRRDDMRLAGK